MNISKTNGFHLLEEVLEGFFLFCGGFDDSVNSISLCDLELKKTGIQWNESNAPSLHIAVDHHELLGESLEIH